MRADVLDYVGFWTMQLGFTIFAKLFHFVQFSLLWSFLRKLLRRPLTAANKSKTEPFWICFTHGLRFSPHNQAKRIYGRAKSRGAKSRSRQARRAVGGVLWARSKSKTANCESASTGGKNKACLAKINPRWGMKSMCWTHEVRYIKRWLRRN